MNRLICIITLLIYCSTVSAGTQQKVEEWFNLQNYGNVTNSGVYVGQTARYGTLGGLSARTPVVYPFRFVDIQTPKYTAGCGGIDFYAGGFSAVNADKFVESLRAIGQNAKSLAFMLALQIVTPQLSGVMEDVQNWANKYLNMNIDSCQAATKLMGGTMDLFGAKEGNCTIKRMQDRGEDWNTANYACTMGTQLRSTEGTEPNKVDFVKGNLAWYVLMQDPLFSADTEFAELVMNITGTIIISDAGSSWDDPSSIRIIEPSIKDIAVKDRFENIYNAILMGKDAQDKLAIYRCQDRTSSRDGCVKLIDEIQSVTPTWDGLNVRVKKLIASIVDKIYKDQNLSSEEIGLISSTSIPLYRYLAATSAFYVKSSGQEESYRYVNLISEDILLRSLKSIMSKVEQVAASQPMAETKRLLKFREDIQDVLTGISRMKSQNDKSAVEYLQMQQQIQNYERMMMSRLSSSLITNAMWRN